VSAAAATAVGYPRTQHHGAVPGRLWDGEWRMTAAIGPIFATRRNHGAPGREAEEIRRQAERPAANRRTPGREAEATTNRGIPGREAEEMPRMCSRSDDSHTAWGTSAGAAEEVPW
jgi:hypothetical protein